ncbi:MAG: hypothetical protein JST51_09655 [Armatimonadetes bacterium]|nr:hypothetical protein [Armatimonadota bacterium]
MKFGRLLVALLATQVILGCQNDDEPAPQPMKVDVPTSMDNPSELVGDWTETKGQKVSLKADGTCELISKVSLGSDVTRGEAKNFDQKTEAKWGTKGDQFFFTDMKSSPSLKYDWKLDGDKLMLSTNGVKLTYSRSKEEKKEEKK